MSIKVIEKYAQKYRVVCSKCHSILEYDDGDIISEEHSYYDGSHDLDRGFHCPICKNWIDHNEKNKINEVDSYKYEK